MNQSQGLETVLIHMQVQNGLSLNSLIHMEFKTVSRSVEAKMNQSHGNQNRHERYCQAIKPTVSLKEIYCIMINYIPYPTIDI